MGQNSTVSVYMAVYGQRRDGDGLGVHRGIELSRIRHAGAGRAIRNHTWWYTLDFGAGGGAYHAFIVSPDREYRMDRDTDDLRNAFDRRFGDFKRLVVHGLVEDRLSRECVPIGLAVCFGVGSRHANCDL